MMKKYLSLIVLLVAPASTLFADGITLLGTVRDRNRGQAISAATVQVFDRNGVRLGTTSSNPLGHWQLTIPLVGVHDGADVPRAFSLDQNYPNPFNPSTKLPFTINREGSVRFSVHNILGQELDSKEFTLVPGSYTIDWSTRGSAGVLFYSIEMDNVRLTRKMVQLDGGSRSGLGNVMPATRIPSFVLQRPHVLDSCRVVTTSPIYEADTLTIAFVDSARANVLLESVHDRAVVIDLHNDVMERIAGSGFSYQIAARHSIYHTDIPRLKEGGVDAQVFSMWVSPTTYPSSVYFSTAMKFLDTMKAQVKRSQNDIGLVTRVDSAEGLMRQKKIAGIVVLEGGHCIEDKLENLYAFYTAGVRVMTITWNNSTSWAISAQDSRADSVGLNGFGKQVVRSMDSLGMVIDVSHVGRKTVDDILATSKNPIIASHSGAYALRSHYRNLTDTQIRAIAQRGGVIGVVFYPPYLVSGGQATMNSVIQHIDYIKNLVGIDYVALGSDFDGIESTPTGLGDVTRFPALTEALLQRGYSRQDVRKILGENFMRVFKTVCK